MSKEEKKEELSEKLADKEDEQDTLFEKITESFKGSIDFIGDYAREGLEYLEDASDASHFEEGINALSLVAEEIKHMKRILDENDADISRLKMLEEEIEKLEKEI
tara:strand:+ start:7946 stop:8260 length:315 start_codon:yes stop_codon:yes gene_type:complete